MVNHQLNYHIIPFSYELDYKNSNKLMKEMCDLDLWKCEDISDDNLLRHVNNLITNKENIQSTIAKRYVLQQEGRGNKFLNLPKKKDYTFIFSVDEKYEYKVKIDSIELYLFETQVGFVVFKFQYLGEENDKKLDLDTLIDINYYIKHLNLTKNMLCYDIKKSKDCIEKHSTTIAELIYKITENFNVKTYFDNREDSKPYKTLLYSTVLLEEEIDESELSKYLYKMRRVFKDSYKPSPEQLQIKDNEEIVHLFKNSYWGSSLEGLTNICYKVDDNKTNLFMSGTYKSKLENSYLFIYLLILNMRYSLLNFSLLCSELPNNIDECTKLESINPENKISVSKLEEMISFFTLRCVFRDVSNITHQSILYKIMWKINNIDTLLEELNSEINALSVMTKLRKDKEEKVQKLAEERVKEEKAKSEKEEKLKEEKKNKETKKVEDSFKDIFLLITTAFTFISAVTNIEKISVVVSKLANSFYLLFQQREVTPELDMLIFILVLLTCFIILYVKYMINRGKIRLK